MLGSIFLFSQRFHPVQSKSNIFQLKSWTSERVVAVCVTYENRRCKIYRRLSSSNNNNKMDILNGLVSSLPWRIWFDLHGFRYIFFQILQSSMDSFSLTHKTLILLLLLLSLSLVLHLFWNMRRRAVQPITKRRSIQILTEFKVELKNVLLFASLSSFRFGIFCQWQIATKYDSILKSNVKTLCAPTEDEIP